jgi:hypothetical protein
MKNNSKISLLIEGYPRNGFQTYAKIVGHSGNGACIARLHPEYVAQKYGLERVKRYWLSGQKGDEVISPRSMHHLIKILRSELRGREDNVLFLDGLEYLLLYNEISKVMGALEEIDNILRSAGAELIITVDPQTLEQKDVDRLWDSFPRYTAEELLIRFDLVQPQQISVAGRAICGPEIADL